MAFKLPRLLSGFAIVTREGLATSAFHGWWQTVTEQIETNEDTQNQIITDLTQTQAELATTQGELAAAVADIVAAQSDISSIQADLPTFVVKDSTAAPVYAAYAGQVISNPPTQAEVQALDAAVVAQSTAITALIAALQSADVFS